MEWSIGVESKFGVKKFLWISDTHPSSKHARYMK